MCVETNLMIFPRPLAVTHGWLENHLKLRVLKGKSLISMVPVPLPCLSTGR